MLIFKKIFNLFILGGNIGRSFSMDLLCLCTSYKQYKKYTDLSF